MKLNQLFLTGIVTALTMGTSKAVIPFQQEFEKLNIFLVAGQQELDNVETTSSSNIVTVSTIKYSTISNKDILNMLATAMNTNWPDGARLALDAHGEQIYVVDKTGTNPVFNLSAGINNGDTNIVYFDIFFSLDVLSGRSVNSTAGPFTYNSSQTFYGQATSYLYIKTDGIVTTDIVFNGLYTEKSYQSVVNNTNIFIDGIEASLGGAGLLDNKEAFLKGNLTSSGKFKYNESIP